MEYYYMCTLYLSLACRIFLFGFFHINLYVANIILDVILCVYSIVLVLNKVVMFVSMAADFNS